MILLNINLHNAHFSSISLDLRKHRSFFHSMVGVEDFSPAFGVGDEGVMVLGRDV